MRGIENSYFMELHREVIFPQNGVRREMLQQLLYGNKEGRDKKAKKSHLQPKNVQKPFLSFFLSYSNFTVARVKLL